jgi:hypothetical protein
MEFIPFKQVGDFLFNQSFDEIRKSLSAHKHVQLGERVELDKRYPSIYVPDLEVFIVFDPDGRSVRAIEVESDIYLSGINLHSTSLSKLKSHFFKLDDKLVTEEEGEIESRKLGFIISKDNEKDRNTVFVYSKRYMDEDKISPDDIIKFYLGS